MFGAQSNYYYYFSEMTVGHFNDGQSGAWIVLLLSRDKSTVITK